MLFQKFIRQNLYQRSILSYLLFPLSIIFASIQVIRRKIYLLIPGLSYKSPCKIISIGNIVSGGSGKTPFTIFLAKYLTGKGYNIAVSHRGYKGNFEDQNKLISTKDEIYSFAEKAGDEACLLANKLPGIPVIAGKNRKMSIQILLEIFPELDYIILDDSFQHLKVKHDIDFVIVNALGGLGNGFLLPAGILREPVSVLKNADFIIFNGNRNIPDYLEKYAEKVILGHYKIKGIYDLSGNNVGIDELHKKRIALLSGIGIPESFEKTISELGLNFEVHLKFPDHYDYNNPSALKKINSQLEHNKIDIIITTEKDFVKLKYIEKIETHLAVLEIEFHVSNYKLIENL